MYGKNGKLNPTTGDQAGEITNQVMDALRLKKQSLAKPEELWYDFWCNSLPRKYGKVRSCRVRIFCRDEVLKQEAIAQVLDILAKSNIPEGSYKIYGRQDWALNIWYVPGTWHRFPYKFGIGDLVTAPRGWDSGNQMAVDNPVGKVVARSHAMGGNWYRCEFGTWEERFLETAK